MNRKILVSTLVLFVFLFLSGCDADLLSDKHRLQALNEAGAAYGLEFGEARGEIPDMPDGAIFFTDADERGKVVTEVFLKDSSMLKEVSERNASYRGFSYFILEDHKIAVFFDNIHGILEEESFLAKLYGFRNRPHPKKIILIAKGLDSWTNENADFFVDECQNVVKIDSDNLYALGEFLFNETHNTESPYYHIDDETPEAVIDDIIYNSLRETQVCGHYLDDNSPIPIGNIVDKSMLSKDVWTVYCIPYRLDWENSETAMQRKMNIIRNDFLFLLEHHLSASDID